MKILFLVPYPLKRSPSQRFRFEQYFDALMNAGHRIRVQSFLTTSGWNTIYKTGHQFQKFFSIVNGFFRRLLILPYAASADMIFIHREVAPVGPPVFEWIIAKVFRKKIIYDFDDAIWLTDKTSEGVIERTIRWRSKVASICRWSYKVSCGNDFLCDYARRFNSNVVLNPTTIDTDYHKPVPKMPTNKIVIGWTGSHSTLKYLDLIVPALQHLEAKYPQLEFVVIANAAPSLPLKSLKFVKWTEATEINDLGQLNIGIMPLPDDVWSKGKCGFKALQYMAMEIPAVVSPVGVNTKIVTNNVNGFIASTTEEWESALEKLIVDREMRLRIGNAGRQSVVDSYSVSSNTASFVGLFDRSAMMASATR